MTDAKTDLKSMLKDPSLLETRAYIGGEWVDGDDGTFDVVNPARGDVIAKVANLSRAQVAGAIAQAEKAQKEWASWTGKERAGVMRKWESEASRLMDEKNPAIAGLWRLGKPWGSGRFAAQDMLLPQGESLVWWPVSYTHLTLPTIYSV